MITTGDKGLGSEGQEVASISERDKLDYVFPPLTAPPSGVRIGRYFRLLEHGIEQPNRKLLAPFPNHQLGRRRGTHIVLGVSGRLFKSNTLSVRTCMASDHPGIICYFKDNDADYLSVFSLYYHL